MSTLIRRSAPIFRLNSCCSGFYWTRYLHNRAVNGTPTGLYGFDQLKTPKGFRRFVDEAIERSTELVDYIAEMPSSMEIIRTMDEISDTVCSVVDSAELCRQTHPVREFVEEANKASMRINEYLHVSDHFGSKALAESKIPFIVTCNYLNTNHTLYDAVKKAEKDAHLLSREAHRAASHLRIDFEKGGIHLCPEKLDQVNQLNIDIFQLCRE
ncbi:hypothetical protein Pint_17258 [Pistacia integerrima]|uniref:Uncharacterized protein n=1 Tax=Pistacia integerrima TaxID=434235 RepID=A0ACC0Z1X6_9ROSI|nr:hypothetical protein Pint_17258 [Pistacia integerrima]